jgi:hypothetical protein
MVAIALAGVCCEATALAADEPADAAEAAGVRRALILCGLPGDPEHRQAFAETVKKLRDSLISRYGFAESELRIHLAEPPADNAAIPHLRGKATREEIAAEAADLSKVLQPQDTLWVIVVGHAYWDGKQSFFNIPGPDLHQAEFGKLFADLPAREQVFFIATPASGYYIKPLSAKGRVVITATQADAEVNETIFPMALASVLETPPDPETFDADQDGTISLFDLYVAVTRDVADRYLKEKRVATEHALLDDNGDGRGTELQIDYLTIEQGGRAEAGRRPRARKGNTDGTTSARILLRP